MIKNCIPILLVSCFLLSCDHDENIDPLERQIISDQWVNVAETTSKSDQYTQVIPEPLNQKVWEFKHNKKYFTKYLDFDGDTIVFTGKWKLDKTNMILDFVDLDTVYYLKKTNRYPFLSEVSFDWKILKLSGDTLEVERMTNDTPLKPRMILKKKRSLTK